MGVVRLTTTAGAWAPVLLADALDFARVDLPEDERVVQRLVEAAAQEVERYSGHVLLPGTFRVTFDHWSRRLELPLTPVTAVSAVRYQAADGTATTVDAADYYVDLSAVPGRVAFDVRYAPVCLRSLAGLEVDVAAGYATPQAVPADIQQHVLTLALLMHEHRDDLDALNKVRRYAADGAGAFSVVTL